MTMSDCGARFETMSGETVYPCDLPSGHMGPHQGYILGSRCSWGQGRETEWDEVGVCDGCGEHGVWRTLNDGRRMCEGCLVMICNQFLAEQGAHGG